MDDEWSPVSACRYFYIQQKKKHNVYTCDIYLQTHVGISTLNMILNKKKKKKKCA